jgi:hypothetical protein
MIRERFSEYLRRIDTLANAGIAAPREFETVRRNYDDYRRMQLTAAERLAHAVTNPAKHDDLNALHAMALAEQAHPGQQAAVDGVVAGVIEARLRELYAPHAKDIYGKAAVRFNGVAEAFAAAASVTDVETTDAADVAAMADDQRAAWTAAAALAAELDTALSLLTVAAQLAGVDVNDETGSVVSLCVDTTTAAKRVLWAAWDVRGTRTGRWGALAAAGARIAAQPLETIQPFPRPAPLEHRLVPTGMVGVYEEKILDPESPDYTAPDEPNRALIPGHRLTTR